MPHPLLVPQYQLAKLPHCHCVGAGAGRQPHQLAVDVANAVLVCPHAQQHIPGRQAGENTRQGGIRRLRRGCQGACAFNWQFQKECK